MSRHAIINFIVINFIDKISGMVEKTKRAISILQHRGSDTATNQDTTMISDMKRQTEEKIAEFRRNAEDAVNQVNIY